MNVITTTVPATIQIRRSHLFALIAAVASVAVVSTWAIASNSTPGAEKARVAVKSGAAALSTRQPQAAPVASFTPTQLRSIRWYYTPNAAMLQQNAQSSFESLTPTQLRSIRWYYTPGAATLTAKQQNAQSTVASFTPTQLRSIRWYFTPSAAMLQQNAQSSFESLTPTQLRSIRWYYTPSSSH